MEIHVEPMQGVVVGGEYVEMDDINYIVIYLFIIRILFEF